jgi:hypothetical protein
VVRLGALRDLGALAAMPGPGLGQGLGFRVRLGALRDLGAVAAMPGPGFGQGLGFRVRLGALRGALAATPGWAATDLTSVEIPAFQSESRVHCGY